MKLYKLYQVNNRMLNNYVFVKTFQHKVTYEREVSCHEWHHDPLRTWIACLTFLATLLNEEFYVGPAYNFPTLKHCCCITIVWLVSMLRFEDLSAYLVMPWALIATQIFSVGNLVLCSFRFLTYYYSAERQTFAVTKSYK